MFQCDLKLFYRGHISSPFDSPSPPGPEFEDIIPLEKPKQGIKRRFEEAHIPQPNTWPSPIQKHFAEPTEVQAGPNGHIIERPLKKQKRLSHPARVVEDVTLLSCGHCKREFRAKATYRKQFGHFLVNHKCSGNDRMQFVIGVKHRRCTFSCHPNVGCVNFSWVVWKLLYLTKCDLVMKISTGWLRWSALLAHCPCNIFPFSRFPHACFHHHWGN